MPASSIEPNKVTLWLPRSKVPSWNELLSAHHWKRTKIKRAIQDDMLCALRAIGDASWMKITSLKNTTLTPFATLVAWQRTQQIKRESRLFKSK